MMQIGVTLLPNLKKVVLHIQKDRMGSVHERIAPNKDRNIARNHGQGLNLQGTKKSGEKIVNIFGKSYIVPKCPTQQIPMGIDPILQNDDLASVPKGRHR